MTLSSHVIFEVLRYYYSHTNRRRFRSLNLIVNLILGRLKTSPQSLNQQLMDSFLFLLYLLKIGDPGRYYHPFCFSQRKERQLHVLRRAL